MRWWQMVTVVLAALTGCVGGDPVEYGLSIESVAESRDSLVADFRWDFERETTGPTSCPVVATMFTDRSNGEPTSWRWEFPGGATSEEQNPTIDKNIAGTVILTVSVNGISSTIEKDVRNNLVC